MSSIKPELCPLCTESLEDLDNVNQLYQKGADGINKASAERGDSIYVTTGTKVHPTCRKRYTNPADIKLYLNHKSKPSSSIKRSVRVSSCPFDSKTDWFFCGTTVVPGRPDVSCVKTDTFSNAILECCDIRSDNWALIVKGRIKYYGGDIHAADCVYHHSCSCNFRTGRDIPSQFRNEHEPKRSRQSGRPTNDDQEQAFSQMCFYLENNDEEQQTISGLRDKMKEFITGEDSLPYGQQYLKSKLQKRYSSSIYIAEGTGLNDIVTMREKTAQILRSYFSQKTQEGDEESQKRAIIEIAARLIKSDIKTNVPSVTDQYPSTEALKLDAALMFIPETLRTLLSNLFVGKDTQRKVASIGQAIIQAVRPRAVLAPLQVGLAVQTHHLYRSKFIVDTLNEMGFCSSYGEVLRFEKNAADSVAPDMVGEDIDILNTSLLFAGDNVDHNILTIDGKGTFHGMGMVAALTPGQKTVRSISRRNMSEVKITEKTKIDIIEYRFANNAHRNIKFDSFPPLIECDMRVDILWELPFSYKQETPNWQGMMHAIHQGYEHPGQSSIVFLPMIDMYPGDKTCILSTLEFLYNLATNHHVSPVITFDQPLYWKAAEIITDAPENSHLKQIVLMLGCFHTFMNLLGAIGTLMDGTGLTNILEVVYGDNAVVHMMTGKSVQRSFRGHLLVDNCLNHMIVSAIVNKNQSLHHWLISLRIYILPCWQARRR